MGYTGYPEAKGLYDPCNEHDSCGVGFVVDIKNRKSHDIVRQGLQILVNLDHRGAVGADPLAGDGAGILVQIPDRFFREECAGLGIDLPAPGDYAVGMLFLSRDPELRAMHETKVRKAFELEGHKVLGWRDVPVDDSCLGYSVKPDQPCIRQLFVAKGENMPDQDAFERKLFVARKQAHHAIWDYEESREAALACPVKFVPVNHAIVGLVDELNVVGEKLWSKSEE